MKPSNSQLAIGILSLSLLTIMAGAAVSPALADIQANLQGATPTLTKMILTMPAVFIIPTSYAVGRWSPYLPKKKLALAGVFIYTVAGCWAAFFSYEIYSLLASRALLGIAVGIIMPVAVALIADFYHGEERLKMMGYNSSFANFGGIIATFSSGLLASIDWRMAFLVYGIGIPVFIIGALFIKEPPVTRRAKDEKRKKLPIEAYMAALPAFFVFLGFYTIPTNIAVYLIKHNLGGPPQAGYALALSTGTAMVVGFNAAKIRKTLKGFFVPSIVLSMFLCHMMLGFAHTFLTVNIAMIMNGYFLSTAIPYIMLKATENSNGHNVGATSAVTSFVFLGQFFSPVIFDYAAKLYGTDDAVFSFRAVAIFSFITLVTVLATRLKRGISR